MAGEALPVSFRRRMSRLSMEQRRDSRHDKEVQRLGLKGFVRPIFAFRYVELRSRRQLESRDRAQHPAIDKDALDPIDG